MGTYSVPYSKNRPKMNVSNPSTFATSQSTLALGLHLRLHPYVTSWFVATMSGIETFIFRRFLLYVPTTAPYKPPSQPMRAPHMWGVERDPRASLGRRGAHRD